jgi:hypothetical protein
MDLTRSEGNYFNMSVNSDECRAIHRSLTLWGGQPNLPTIAAAQQLMIATALITPDTPLIRGLRSDVVELLGVVLSDFNAHAERLVDRAVKSLEYLEKPTTFSGNPELDQIIQIGRVAGELAIDVKYQLIGLTDPVTDHVPNDWLQG